MQVQLTVESSWVGAGTAGETQGVFSEKRTWRRSKQVDAAALGRSLGPQRGAEGDLGRARTRGLVSVPMKEHCFGAGVFEMHA